MAYTQFSQLQIEGGLVKKKEILTSKAGRKYINFTIVNNRAKNPNDNTSEEVFKTWIECTAFGKDAEFINELPTGALLSLTGQFYQNEYEYKGEDGNTKTYRGLSLLVDRLAVTRFTYLNQMKDFKANEPSPKAQSVAKDLGLEIGSNDDDLPF